VVRVSLEVIQVDAVVTDKAGRYVTDLTAGDFEILEDGHRQAITHCSYVPLAAASPSTSQAAPAPPRSLRPEDVRRTMAFVVDDLSLSFESVVRVRNLLAHFVDRQMQPGDLAAVVQVSAGMSALEQFTADRHLLHAAINRIRFKLSARVSLATVSEAMGDGAAAGGPGGAALAAANAQLAAVLDKSERRREALSTAGTLGALNFVLRGLRSLPGRKSVLLLSEGFSLYDEDGAYSTWLADAVERAADSANRGSVVIYPLDPSGLQSLRADASSAFPKGKGGAATLEKVRAGLRTMASDTGGFFLGDTNDLGEALGKILEDQRGYYLIGYDPNEGTFQAGKGGPVYHRITVRVKRPGLRVRSRKGFYAVPDSLERPAPESPTTQLLAAVASPFAATDLRVRLTSLFGYEADRGSYLRSLLHMDARDLTFIPGPDGSHRTEVLIAILSFGADGRILEQLVRSDGIRVAPGGLDTALRDGLVYLLDLPVKKAGALHVRVAVRDAGSGRLGCGSQLVEVPDVAKGRLALSGVVVGAAGPGVHPQASPAVRRFRPGARVPYSFFVYNAQRDPRARSPHIEVRTSLLREGVGVLSLPPALADAAGPSGASALAVGGAIVLPPTLEPGVYALQVSVLDLLAKSDRRLAVQVVDLGVLLD